MIVISDSVVLSLGPDANVPRIGWRNVLTASNVFASQQDPDHPVTNLANPSTFLYWKGLDTSEQFVGTVLGGAASVNYVGIARHNLGSTGAAYTIEVSEDGGSTWDSVDDARIPANDFALIHEFDTQFAAYYRLRIVPGSGVPEIGVLYIGEILRLQRRIYVGHVPFVFGRDTTVSTGWSEEGQFLGRVVRRRMYHSSVSMGNITPQWYRTELDPFFHAAPETPFFWAWRPGKYPLEVGYAWLTGDGAVSNQRENGMMQIDFRMQGIR